MYSAIWAIPDRGSVRRVFVVALAMALVGALYVPAQAQTGGAAARSWPGSQGAGAFPAANGPGQGRLHRPRRAASAQTSSNLDIESLLYNFCSQGGVYCTDGIQPSAGLIEDASGNLYGTTKGGEAPIVPIVMRVLAVTARYSSLHRVAAAIPRPCCTTFVPKPIARTVLPLLLA